MKSIEIGKSAVVASQAALGVMRMDALDADAAAEVVRTAAEHGVNFFDTADIYGFNVNHDHASSRVLGRAWKDAGLKREDIFLQTKFGINIDFSDPNNVHATRYDFSAKHLITRLDEELEALGTDYVDFALLHRPDTLMEAEEIVEAVHIDDFILSYFLMKWKREVTKNCHKTSPDHFSVHDLFLLYGSFPDSY